MLSHHTMSHTRQQSGPERTTHLLLVPARLCLPLLRLRVELGDDHAALLDLRALDVEQARRLLKILLQLRHACGPLLAQLRQLFRGGLALGVARALQIADALGEAARGMLEEVTL